MRLEKNISAPVFSLKDIYGREINLEDYRDKKVLLSFFRHAGCPFCNLRVHKLLKVHEELKSKNLEMIFFFESKERVILRSSFHEGISPIPIISDPDKIWYDTYGLEESGLKSTIGHLTGFVQTAIQAKRKGLPIHMMADGESIKTMPAEFLLGEDLIIKEFHYSDRLTDRLEISKIMEFADREEKQIKNHIKIHNSQEE